MFAGVAEDLVRFLPQAWRHVSLVLELDGTKVISLVDRVGDVTVKGKNSISALRPVVSVAVQVKNEKK